MELLGAATRVAHWGLVAVGYNQPSSSDNQRRIDMTYADVLVWSMMVPFAIWPGGTWARVVLEN